MDKTFIAIGVNSMEESVSFYCDFLKFQVEKRLFPNDQIEICWLTNEFNFPIELIERKDQAPIQKQDSSLCLSFKTKDFDKFKNHFDQNQYPYECFALPKAGNCMRLTDPNGIAISIIE